MAKKKKEETLLRKLSKKTVGKKVLKKSQATVTITERPTENIFHEENKFFKNEFDREKKNMFLN